MAYLGLIEGFYGKKFKDADRLDLLSFLQGCGYQFYIYAPKEERALRQDLLQGLPAASQKRLEQLRAGCTELGLDFGLALSPYNLTATYPSIKERFLQLTASYARQFKPDLLCLLFDDQKVSGTECARVQRQIIEDVLQILPDNVKRFIICPSYYSFDPLLDKLFGARPDNYFATLCQHLPERVEIFWTGNNIVSADISPEDVSRASEILGRRPFIWDNYPVNDGKNISNFLYLKPFNGRRGLAGLTSGHAVNPMLQCPLNAYVLKTLAQKYAGIPDPEIAGEFEQNLRTQLGKGADILMEQLTMLTERGLNRLNALQKAMLTAACELERNNPALKEIKDFLSGKYVFDPACLT